MVTTETDVDVVLSVSTEHYPTSVSVVTDLNISLRPNESETVRHSSPCVDLVLKTIEHT